MHPTKSPIYQTQQIREFERLVQDRFGITGDMLMQRAGKAAFDFFMRRWPQAQKVAVFCGAGNNGGDGYVFAQAAHERGLKVMIWQVGNHDNMKPEAKNAFEQCRRESIPMYPFDDKVDLQHPDIVVDAICGIGVSTNLREDVILAIERMQRLQVPIFAMDIPSGIDADTGKVLGGAVRATATMTFIGYKLGLMTGNGTAYTGELVCHDLQLPAELFSFVDPVAEKIHLSSFSTYLKPRLRDWHKGLSGHVLIVGGELGFGGAVSMAGQAALRVGAGLVSIVTRPEHAAALTAKCPELMYHGIKKAADMQPLIERADVIVIGTGLGKSTWSKALWNDIMTKELPMVVDGDGLNILAEHERSNDNWVLTPHPGEAARLLEQTSQEIQGDRLEAIRGVRKRYGGVCVLKGAGSLVAAPHVMIGLCDKGNPGMATAGMGDVLSGVIGGLMAQGIPMGDAAKLGVSLHAMAGDLAAKEGECGMMATDLMPYLRRLVNFSV